MTQSRSIHGVVGKPIEVGRLGKGDYFGEMALLKKQPRAANIIAHGYVSCVALSEKDFNFLMGPCEDLLKRNMQSYKTIGQILDSQKQEAYGISNPNPEFPRDFFPKSQ